MVSPPAHEICESDQDPADDQVDIQQPLVDPHSHDEHPEISLHALAEVTAPQTMQVKGFFKKIPLTILIDSGRTHKFIDPQISKQADSFVHPCSIFQVMVANGIILPCKGKCRNVCISIGDYNLCSDMFSLPLGGCDVVLGAQWLWM